MHAEVDHAGLATRAQYIRQHLMSREVSERLPDGCTVQTRAIRTIYATGSATRRDTKFIIFITKLTIFNAESIIDNAKQAWTKAMAWPHKAAFNTAKMTNFTM